MFKYYYDNGSRTFKPALYDMSKKTCAQIHAEYTGLDEATVKDNMVFYGKNLTEIPRKSCLKLLVDEVLTPFYIFQVR